MNIERRDLFAAAAIAGLAANGANPNSRVEDAWEIADDMIAWGGKGEPQGSSDSTEASPFADINSEELPVDLGEALEQFKLAIIRHRADRWQEVSQAKVAGVANALAKFVYFNP